MSDVTEERVANLQADIDTIMDDLEEFAVESYDRTHAIAALTLAKSYIEGALRGHP